MFYGWVILGIATVATLATSPGQSYLVGKFNAEIEAALGIGETTLTAAYGIATFAAAFPLLYVGKLADRFGPRAIMGASALLLGVACWTIGLVQGPISLALCYFLLRFAGQGVLGLSASHSVAMWFERRLGTATGAKMFAMPLAIFFLPMLTTHLIGAHGWKTAYGLLGVGVWVTVLPLVVFFHRNKPEDIGQRVDGDPPDDPEPDPTPHAHPEAELIAGSAIEQPLAIDLIEDEDQAGAAWAFASARNGVGEVCFTRPQAMRTGAYWIIVIAMTTNALIATAFVFLLQKMASEIGLGEGADNRLLGVFAVASVGFGVLAGVATDRLAPRWVIGSASGLLVLSCALFALGGCGMAQDHRSLVIALAWGSMVSLSASQSLMFVGGSTLFARFFGRPHHGAIRASLTFFMVSGTSAGPFLTAALAQGVGYVGALWVFAGASLPITVAGLLLTRPVAPKANGVPWRP